MAMLEHDLELATKMKKRSNSPAIGMRGGVRQQVFASVEICSGESAWL